MNSSSSNFRIEPLTKENYDTWKVQAQAVLIRNYGAMYQELKRNPDSSKDTEL